MDGLEVVRDVYLTKDEEQNARKKDARMEVAVKVDGCRALEAGA